MKILFFLSMTIFLSGCLNVATVQSPTGEGVAFTLDCNGLKYKGAECYQKASELCPNGYDILDSTTQALGQNMLIQCKE